MARRPTMNLYARTSRRVARCEEIEDSEGDLVLTATAPCGIISAVAEAWCSGLTCRPVKPEIAGSSPVASASMICRRGNGPIQVGASPQGTSGKTLVLPLSVFSVTCRSCSAFQHQGQAFSVGLTEREAQARVPACFRATCVYAPKLISLGHLLSSARDTFSLG